MTPVQPNKHNIWCQGSIPNERHVNQCAKLLPNEECNKDRESKSNEWVINKPDETGAKNERPMLLKTSAMLVVKPMLKKINVESSFFESPAVEAVLTEYSNDVVNIQEHIETASRLYLWKTNHLPNSTALVKEIENLQNTDLMYYSLSKHIQNEKRIQQSTQCDVEMKMKLLKREKQYLQKRLLCEQCKIQPRQIVSLPCGHISLCQICAQRNDICVTCNKKVLAEATIYLS